MVELDMDGHRDKMDTEFSQSPTQDRRIGTIIDSEWSLPLRIGTGLYRNVSESFLGASDEILILPRALSEQEVRSLIKE